MIAVKCPKILGHKLTITAEVSKYKFRSSNLNLPDAQALDLEITESEINGYSF